MSCNEYFTFQMIINIANWWAWGTECVGLQVNVIIINTSNSMGSSEMWDKYHKRCIENR